MRKGGFILLFGLVLGAAAFFGFYYLGTAPCRHLMHEPQPELAWLKREFGLSDAEFARITALHEAYLPQCAERCRVIDSQNAKLRELLAQGTTVTPEIRDLLVERAKTRAQCEAEMLNHFQQVSGAMPPEQSRRYLAWVQDQTVLRPQTMESRHHMNGSHHPTEEPRRECGRMNVTDGDERDAHDMARLAAGHDAVLDSLMDRHAQRLFRYLLRSLQDAADAEDLAQETFVRVYQNCARFDPRQKFTTWLYAIASNLVRDRYRRRSRRHEVSLDAEEPHPETSLKNSLPAADAAPDQDLLRAERAETVRQAIADLPEELRQPLILAVYQGLPQAEIAAILQCSVKAVETRIYRARQQLRLQLAKLL